MWMIVEKVSTGLTLLAFVAASVVVLVRTFLARDDKLIRQAPEAERSQRVDAALEKFRIDTAGLSGAAKERLLRLQLEGRERRLRLVLYFLLAALLISVTGWIVSNRLHRADGSLSSNAAAASAVPSSTPNLAAGKDGGPAAAPCVGATVGKIKATDRTRARIGTGTPCPTTGDIDLSGSAEVDVGNHDK